MTPHLMTFVPKLSKTFIFLGKITKIVSLNYDPPPFYDFSTGVSTRLPTIKHRRVRRYPWNKKVSHFPCLNHNCMVTQTTQRYTYVLCTQLIFIRVLKDFFRFQVQILISNSKIFYSKKNSFSSNEAKIIRTIICCLNNT